MNVDDKYTIDDHEFRESDPYAAAKYDLTLRWLRKRRLTGSLANIGCGGGVFNRRAVAAGFRVHAFEPDKAAFALAERDRSEMCSVEQLGIFDLPDLAVDVAVMHDVLEHIDAEAAAVERLAAIIRPGGSAIVSVPAMESLFGYHDRQLGHFRRYSRSSLRRALRPHFDVESVRYFGMSMVPIAWWYSRIRESPYPTAGVGDTGLINRVMNGVLHAETFLPMPVGTSVVAFARRR